MAKVWDMYRKYIETINRCEQAEAEQSRCMNSRIENKKPIFR